MTTHADTTCEFLPWDSEFFGHRIGRVCGDTMDQGLAQAADRWAIENSIRTLYFLARSDDPATTRTAEKHGYTLADVRMTFERAVDLAPSRAMSPASGYAIRQACLTDVPGLQKIAAAGHVGTRFANDPHFARERVQAFYSTWIALECQGRAQQVLVSASREGEPLGYISCHLGPNGTGEIGLVGVNERYRSNGLGSALVRAALSWFLSQQVRRVTVVTQGNNKPAQRLYQKNGFLTQNVQLWFHKWFPESD